ncbi:MAG: hypothetical protein WC341_09120 [Bacteroidales bacterium]|jgi:hypothetical protein
MSTIAKNKNNPQNALDFTRGQGKQRRTFYKCGVLETARDEKIPLQIVDRSGKLRIISPDKPVRMVHRPKLDDHFGDTHDLAGKGKYITLEAISQKGTKRLVEGAQNVNPYLAEAGSYHTIVQCFHNLAGERIHKMVAEFAQSSVNGQHLVWQGKPRIDGAITVSKWANEDELWELANKINPGLRALLRTSKAAIKQGVKKHAVGREKFINNLHVLRRSRSTFRVATGETEYRGGETPYAVPLEQCGMAIDMFYLTNGTDEDGHEIGAYYYRMAYGRSTPWTLYYRDWLGMGPNDKIAYMSAQA